MGFITFVKDVVPEDLVDDVVSDFGSRLVVVDGAELTSEWVG